jgi:predicted dehydrogenase
MALVGRDRARTEECASRLGVPVATDDPNVVFNDPQIEVVHICTPNDSHAGLATQALEAGKHVVVEKPLAIHSGDARELTELARERGLHAMVCFTYRGFPMVRHAREIVASGEAGRLWLAHSTYVQDWLALPSDYNWRVDATVGGTSRAVADIGCHAFDTLEWVTGDRVEALTADMATVMPVRQRPAEGRKLVSETVRVQSEDAAAVLLRFAGGAHGVLSVSQVSAGRENAFSFELAGSGRTVRWDHERPEQLWLGSRDASQTLNRTGKEPRSPMGVPPLPPGHPEGWGSALRDVIQPFYAEVFEGRPPVHDAAGIGAKYPTLADGARAVSFVEAVVRSSTERTWVELDDLGGSGSITDLSANTSHE